MYMFIMCEGLWFSGWQHVISHVFTGCKLFLMEFPAANYSSGRIPIREIQSTPSVIEPTYSIIRDVSSFVSNAVFFKEYMLSTIKEIIRDVITKAFMFYDSFLRL